MVQSRPLFEPYAADYCDKMCVYDEHPGAGRDLQYRETYGWSRLQYPVNATYNKTVMGYQL